MPRKSAVINVLEVRTQVITGGTSIVPGVNGYVRQLSTYDQITRGAVFITLAKGVLFLVWLVCLTGFKQGCSKTYQTNFHDARWQGVARAQEEPTTFLEQI